MTGFNKKSVLHRLMGLVIVLACFLGIGITSEAAVTDMTAPSRVTNVKVTAEGNKHKITWKKVSGVTGYQVYCRDYTSGSKTYKKVKTLKGNGCYITGRTLGKAYGYVVRGYKKKGSQVVYGKLSSVAYGFSPKTSTSSKIIVNPTKTQKYKLVFGKVYNTSYPGGIYTSEKKALSNMKNITVTTWDFKNGKSGTMITRKWTFKVNKNLAPVIVQIFKELFAIKFPIHEVGGYRYDTSAGGHSEHKTGTAIDINWSENPYCSKSQAAANGWKPGVDPYSIGTNSEVAQIFKKYGFSQGVWGNTVDYMHFSYFGT